MTSVMSKVILSGLDGSYIHVRPMYNITFVPNIILS